jgi:adenylate cyclase
LSSATNRTLAVWSLFAGLVSAASHLVGIFVADLASVYMRVPSAVTVDVAALRDAWLVPLQVLAFPAITAASLTWLGPVLRYGASQSHRERVCRRVLGMPVVFALLGLIPWCLSALLSFVVLAAGDRWSSGLVSELVFTPLTAGAMSSLTAWMTVDQTVRSRLVPVLFAEHSATEIRGVWSLGVRSKLLLVVVAIGFIPGFTSVGIMQTARARIAAAEDAALVFAHAAEGIRTMISVFLPIGLLYTVMLARSLTEPLRRIAAAIGRIEAGDTHAGVSSASDDEIGVVARGVNSLSATLREREHILGTFGRVVEPTVRDRLLTGLASADGERRQAAVLFVDLRGFTALAESRPAAEVLERLNSFLGAVTETVRRHDGFVDRFLGDAVLAVFGLFEDGPEALECGSAAALRCAEELQRRFGAAQDGDDDSDEPRADARLRARMGLHAGSVLAGTVGAADRYEFTVVGDTVNVAARLEQLCRRYDCDLLVSAECVERGARAGAVLTLPSQRLAVEVRGRRGTVDVCAVGVRPGKSRA